MINMKVQPIPLYEKARSYKTIFLVVILSKALGMVLALEGPLNKVLQMVW